MNLWSCQKEGDGQRKKGTVFWIGIRESGLFSNGVSWGSFSKTVRLTRVSGLGWVPTGGEERESRKWSTF